MKYIVCITNENNSAVFYKEFTNKSKAIQSLNEAINLAIDSKVTRYGVLSNSKGECISTRYNEVNL